ncbi:MAG: PAS domain S-box protein, partial [Deltaproteobacteria bacterium]
EYMIGVASGRRVLPFAYPVIDSNGRFKGVVVAGIDLDRYREMLDIARLPEGSSLALSDYKHIRLARYPGPEKYAGLPDLPDMVRHMSAEPEEGLFTSIGADSVKRLYAYKRFYLKGSMSPYLFMRVGIPEEKAYSPARQALLLGLILVWSSFIVAMLLAWFVGKAMIVQNIHRLVNATQQLGKGDLTARAGLDYEKGEMGQLAKAFDEMAEKLENSGEVLRLSEEKYRDIFENAVEGIFQTTKGGRFVSANPALAKLFKYDSPQEFMEQITDIARQHYVNPEDRQTYKSILERDGVIKGFETQLFSKDGNIVWASISARVVRNDVGAIICYEGTVEDITERKQAEAFIRDSEEKFSKAFKKSPLLMTISSIENGIYINVNDKFIEVSGFEREEAVGKTSVELGWIKPKDRELIIHDLKKKGSVDGIELELEAKDKRKVLCRFYGEAINIAGQQRLLSIAQDITFSKQAENLLRTSEEMFSKMFYSNPVLVAISTLEEGRFINVNNIFCDKLGYTPGEVIGKTSMELHFFPNPEQRAYIKQVLMATGRVRNIEVQVLAKDGSIINGLFSAEPLLIAGEACWITTMIDITKRKLAEEELLWKTAFLEAQVEATIDGILVVDSNNQKILINQNLLYIW